MSDLDDAEGHIEVEVVMGPGGPGPNGPPQGPYGPPPPNAGPPSGQVGHLDTL